MPSTYLTCRLAVTKFYNMMLGRPPTVPTRFKFAKLSVQPDEARRRRRNDTDGSVRRAAETKLRHQMH
jgi:hypothetical protein